jgi:hypothetical protein
MARISFKVDSSILLWLFSSGTGRREVTVRPLFPRHLRLPHNNKCGIRLRPRPRQTLRNLSFHKISALPGLGTSKPSLTACTPMVFRAFQMLPVCSAMVRPRLR